MNAGILPGYAEADRRRPQGSRHRARPDHSGEADFALFLDIQTPASRLDDASGRPGSYAGAGLDRSSSIGAA